MKITFYTLLFLSSLLSAEAQTEAVNVHSGPYSGFKVFRGSGNQAGAGWNTASYNDSAWLAPVNGSVPDTSVSTGGCDGPNWSPFHSGDTAIWTDVTTHFPDTGCFRKTLRFCGTVTSGSLSVLGDDYSTTYINGHLLGTQQQAVSGETYTLTATQLAWFVPGNNVIAIEVINVNPNCAAMSMFGSLTVDTTGCVYAGINNIDEQDIKISPVPTTGLLRVSLPKDGATYTLSMYDMVGDKLYEQTTKESQTGIDISHVANGIYTLQIRDAQNHTATRRIVKD